MKALELGQQAPDFNALDQNRERFFLSKALESGKVLLAFYPADDTPVCSTQLADYSRNIEAFKKRGVQVYGISISTNESQKKFHEKLKLKFPLLADYDYRVSHHYGVLSFTGMPRRALFLIDQDGKIIYRHVEALPITHRSAEEVLQAIDEVAPVSSPSQEVPSQAEASH